MRMEPVDTHNNQENVFSKRIRAGRRTYFFDVKTTRTSGDQYLIITESRRISEDKYEKSKLFLYKEDFCKFMEALTETIEIIEHNSVENAESPGIE